ncbi:hypothetical protein [Pseudofrankia asymbiotica]|nr:hypothetical protein [Pseudofrankia asymbiotica]
MIGIVVGLTFAFGFGNSWALGLRLGVPVFVAPLVAPAVDLSVVGLLLGTRHLAVHGGPVEVARSARRLLLFASVVTLALNVAEPVIAGEYGKAAFDAVGPLLLIGWGEVGPGLIEAMHAADQQATATDRLAEPERLPVGGSAAPAPVRRRLGIEATAPQGRDKAAREQDLIHRARAENVLHWQHHHRPISAETLRKRMRVGSPTARRLVAQLRSDMDIHSGEGLAATDSKAQPDG